MTKFLLAVCCWLVAVGANAQTMYLPERNKHLPFLERLEILLQKNPGLNITTPKSITRHDAVFLAGMEDSMSGNPSIRLSKIDQENLQSFLRNNREHVTRSAKPGEILFNNPANMLEIEKENFFVALNPVLSTQQYIPREDHGYVANYSAGLKFRALFNEKLGVYASFVRYSELPPSFAEERYIEWHAVPGAGHFGKTDNRYNFNVVRAGVTFRAVRFFDFQIALDRNFIGNGYRSLLLSDFSANQLFAKINTRVWKFKYQHLYSAHVPSFNGMRGRKRPFGSKVVAMHHLSINATRWLNLGVFQALTVTNLNDWEYMLPVMFYPISNLTDNKPENSLAGFEFKANVTGTAQFYGQVLVDNVQLKEITAKNGWWNNRFGIQVGSKYINVAGVDNLDLQIEVNAVRPYTYASLDSMGSYTHYNQPLAHPMGANFFEGIGILRYQPTNKLSTSLRAIIGRQGIDTAGFNYGSNILKSAKARPNEYGFTIPTGLRVNGINTQLLVSYEPYENVFIDASLLIRRLRVERDLRPIEDTVLGNIGLRINIGRREYDY